MDPKLWGAGAWLIIFELIYLFINKVNNDQSIYMYEIEKLKKTLYIICSTLPCPTCSEHARKNINDNSIMSQTNINIILHFFIELYNKFHSYNTIDRKKINNYWTPSL